MRTYLFPFIDAGNRNAVRHNVSALPTRTIRRLTGRPATTFSQFATDYRLVWLPQR